MSPVEPPRHSTPSGPSFGRPVGPARARRALFIEPWVPLEEGVLRKENLVVRDYQDHRGFNHLLVRIRHPGRYDPCKPEVFLIPGILCNGNLFRLSWTGRSFRDLDHPHSFANALAFEGYSVIVIHPRDSQWIYTRYVSDVLGVPNSFSDDFSISDGVEDISFYLSVCSELRNKEGATGGVVLVGFSLGGIKLLDFLASKPVPADTRGLVFLATPVDFESNGEKLIPLIRVYTQVARFLPVEHYTALNLIDRNVILGKRLMRKALGEASPRLVGELIRRVPLVSEVFHVKDPDFDPGMLFPLLSYVLEPVSRTIMEELLYAVREGHLARRETDEHVLDLLPDVLPPALCIRGGADRIVTARSHQVLSEVLGRRSSPLRSCVAPGVGHDDLVVSHAVCSEVLAFLAQLAQETEKAVGQGIAQSS